MKANHIVHSAASLSLACALTSGTAAECPSYDMEIFYSGPAAGVDLLPGANYLAVTGNIPPGDSGLAFYDLVTGDLIHACPDIPGTPRKYRISADGKYAWCTRYYPGDIAKVDLETCQIVETFPIGSWPVVMNTDVSRRYMFAGEDHPGGVNPVEGSLQVIDTWTSQHVAGIPFHGQPGQIAMAPMDRYVYVVSANTSLGTERLYQIDTVDWTVAGTLDLPSIGGNVGISVHPDFGTVYVPSRTSNEILLVDTALMAIVDSIPIGAPGQAFVAPSGDHAIVLHDNLPNISVLCLDTHSVVQTITGVSSNPNWDREICWTADGKTAYVANAYEVVALYSCLRGDANRDGIVDVQDFLDLIRDWGCGL